MHRNRGLQLLFPVHSYYHTCMLPFQLCSYPDPSLLFFSSNVPTIVYYSHFPALIIAILLAVYVLFSNPRGRANQALFIMLAAFASWIVLALIFWAANRPDVIMFVWAVTLLVETLVYAGALYMFYTLVERREPSWKAALGMFVVFLPLVALLPTNASLSGFSLADCLAIEGWVALYYTYALEILFSLWIIIRAVRAYRRANTPSARSFIVTLTIGTILFLLTFASGNIIGSLTGDWEMAQYGIFGMPIFAAFLAYMIVRYQAFNAKLFGAQALIIALLVLVGSQFAFIETFTGRVLTMITFLFVAAIGYFLVRGVRQEIKQKESLAQLTSELEVANAKLTELDKVKNEFLSFATHQMRSPLTSIKWGLETLLDESTSGPLSEPQKALVVKVKDISVNMASTVNDLLDISKIEQGGLVIQKEVFSLADLVHSLADELKPTAEAKKLQFSYASDTPSKYIVTGDQTKLRQVITNLIDNAIKYTDAGSVEVHIGQGDSGRVRVFVKDTGRGLTKEDSEKLFGKFVRAKSGSANKGGSGLGLYLAKKIIEMHAGVLSAESLGEGKGSTFSFTLPFEG